MKNFARKFAAVALAAVMAVSMAACGGGPDKEVASVNDVSITKAQVEGFSSIYTYMLGMDPEKVTDEQRDMILKDYVDLEVMRQHYEGEKKEVYPEGYKDQEKAFLESAHKEGKDFIEKSGVTDEQLKDFFGAQFVTQAAFNEIMAEHPKESMRGEADKYYKEHPDLFKDKDGKVQPIDGFLEDIYTVLYNDIYTDKVEKIKKSDDMKIEIKSMK